MQAGVSLLSSFTAHACLSSAHLCCPARPVAAERGISSWHVKEERRTALLWAMKRNR